jgi:general secretion pathway protein K
MMPVISNNTRGVALITVMLIVALVAILATQMSARLMLQMQRNSNIALNQQAYWYAMGAEAFAKRLLIENFKKEPDSTNLKQSWAQGETSFPVENGSITGEIIDLQACFNLNALRSKPTGAAAKNKKNTANNKQSSPTKNEKAGKRTSSNNTSVNNVLVNLIIGLDIEGVDQFAAEYMVDALSDWLDQDSAIASAGGAEDNDYAAKEFAYLPANNYLASVNELRAVQNFTVATINALKDYVCVLPNTNLLKINVNTVTVKQALLLKALLGISLSDAEQALSARADKGFKDVAEFLSAPELAKAKISPDLKQRLTVDSEYFKLKTTASFNDSYFSLNSIFKVVDNQTVSVISRTIGKQ